MRKTFCAVLLLSGLALSYALGRHQAPRQASAPPARRALYYVDPMHPSYKSSKPGIAPDCGMQLVPVYAGEDGESSAVSSSTQMGAGTVTLDLEKQQLIGVQVVPVETSAGTHDVRLLGRVVAEDTRVYQVNAGVQGWVQGTFSDSVGTIVKKDERLATFYSPDFITFMNGYLAATERGTTEMKEFKRGVQYSADRLRALGVSDSQIKEIGESHQMPTSIDIVSPTDGLIVARGISAGMRFDRQAEFYKIADLSRVWVVAEIFENEAQYFRPGTIAHVALPGPNNKTFAARVTKVPPEIDPATHTLKLRLEADNPGYALRPDMFVDVELPVSAPPGMTVPMDALVDFGLTKRVFVDRGNGVFEPRNVETGWQFGDRVQIVKGLSRGERVVSAGTFLIDSESKLRAAATGAALHSPSMKEGVEPNPASQPPFATRKMPMRSVLNPIKAKQNRQARDPKCGMLVDQARASAAGNVLSYRGTTYYFCSRQDKDDFATAPDRYLLGGHEMASHTGLGHD